jgi:hypothetical protein
MKNLKKTALGALLASALLAGCTQEQITTAPAKASYVAGFNQQRVAGSAETVVRTYQMIDGKRTEVVGAKCSATSDEVRASFATPSKVVLPTFVQRKEYAERGRPSYLRVECTLNGKIAVVSVPAANKEVSTATNAGIGGAILTAVVTGAMAASTPWRYPGLITLEFK